jgi:CheY-like chemotaxis protein/two-component sensor histidine kinase
VIERQVQHLTRLVDDLLDVSRITRGQIELVREPIELASVVARALETASPLIEKSSHHVAVEVAPRGLIVDADPTRLAQVIANLLTNAAKYTPAGGNITVTARSTRGEVELRVADDGVGIAPDVLPTIFDLFTRVLQDVARGQGGLGLGLAIVKSLTELHGGTITAESDGRGRGATFTLRLPRATLAPRAAAGAARARVLPGQGRRILVVDDNQDAAGVLGDMLGSLGYEVAIAHDGPSALRAARDHLPEIAVLDIGLPVMDGYELARRLRTDERHRALHLVALTGYGQESDRARSVAAGFGAHLVKPVSIERLTRVLDELAPAP